MIEQPPVSSRSRYAFFSVTVLLAANASASRLDGGSTGLSPLHMAAWNGHTAIVRALVRAQPAAVDVASRSRGGMGPSGCTALMFASWSGHHDAVRELLRAGASTTATWRGSRSRRNAAS